MSQEAIIAVVSVVIGTILGAFTSDLASKWKEGREDKKLSKSVRTLVSLEIVQNIELIKRQWEILNKAGFGDDLRGISGEKSKYRANAYYKERKVTRYIDLPFREYYKNAFKSQFSYFPVVLKDNELIGVIGFYDRLERLESMREYLHRIEIESDTEEERQLSSNVDYYTPYQIEANKSSVEMDSIFDQIIAEGNPLGVKDEHIKYRKLEEAKRKVAQLLHVPYKGRR